MKIPQEEIDKIISMVDLQSYIESRGVEFTKNSSSYAMTTCPLPGHDDSTPSFGVKHSEQYYNCFGCGRGGNIVDFVKEFDGIDFPKAIKKVADFAGYSFDDEDYFDPEEMEQYREFQTIKGIYVAAAAYMNKVMPPDIRKFLKENYGFTDEFIDEKKIGFDDGDLYNYLKNEMSFSERELLLSGLFYKTKNDYIIDTFDTRIVFWYWKRNEPVYAIGRKTEYTEDKASKDYYPPKYKKVAVHESPTSKGPGRPYISKSVKNRHIYNEEICLNPSDRPEYVVITEGITDAMLAEMMGIPIISPVTTRFSDKDLRKLKNLVEYVDNVYVINDNEENESGLKGALKTAKFLNKQSKRVFIGQPPRNREDDGEKVDLNDFLMQKDMDKDKFEDFLNTKTKSYFEIQIEKMMEYKEEGDNKRYWNSLREIMVEAENMESIPRNNLFERISDAIDEPKTVIKEQYKDFISQEKEKPEYQQSDQFTNDLIEEAKEKSNTKAQQLFKLLLDEGAKFYRSGETSVTMILDGRYLEISEREDKFTYFLSNRFNLNIKNHSTKKLVFEFKAKAWKHASKLKKQTWLYCKKSQNKLYIPLGHETNDILKITPDKIERVFNGSDDGVFVNKPDMMDSWDINLDINREEVAKDMYRKFKNYMALHENDILLFLFTTMSVPLKRYADTTPIIQLQGKSSAGKTATAKQLFRLFYGNGSVIGNMTDASKFDQASVRPWFNLDNLENISSNALEQFLLYSASGGAREKRDMNSQTGTIRQIVDSLVILTAIHPFDKKELINRTITLGADKRYHSSSKDLTIIYDEILENRDRFLSLWVLLLQRVLDNIQTKLKIKRERINDKFQRHFKDRLNGYLSIVWEMAEEFLKLVGHTEKEVEKIVFSWIRRQEKLGKQMDKGTSEIYDFMFNMVSLIQDNSLSKLDPILESYTIEPDNSIVIFAQASHLLSVFRSIARKLGTKTPFKSESQLMSRLTNDIELLEENGWEIETAVKKVNGSNVHKFIYTPGENDYLDADWAKEDF